MQPSITIRIMQDAAIAAGRSLSRNFGEVENLQVSRKGPRDFVSNADTKAEEIIKDILYKFKPQYSFLLEESGEIKGSDHNRRWVVDPLDGTNNFLHGIPHFAVSIALQEVQKGGKFKSIAAVVYAPITGEMYWAEEGKGGYVDNRRLRVANRIDLSEAIIAGYLPPTEKGVKLFSSLPCARRILGCASLELAYVAAGKLDGFWNLRLAPWDMAAGMLLVTEAKGVVSEVNGGQDICENGNIFAASEALAAPLLREAQKLI